MSTKTFAVCLDEIKQHFVFGDFFEGSYTRTVTLSDGTDRTVKLTPMIRDGRACVELNDNGHISYMGLNGTTPNGQLMIQVREVPGEASAASSRRR